jgi:cytochrome c oxidase cbb3-type subunit I/II
LKDLVEQSQKVVVNLRIGSISNAPPDREIIAMIAYLQRLGTDLKTTNTPAAVVVSPSAGGVAIQTP